MSKNFKEYKQLDLVKLAEEVLTDWNQNQIFEKSVSSRDGQENYVFYEGPPSANGLPGIHHVMARAIKDIFCRYQTLQGKQVHRKAGWDTHGLPIELGVEKELGITKEDIGNKISIEDYNKACREAVMRYTGIWNDLTQKMGYWVDLKDPYITYEPKYMESVWWLLKQIYDKGLLYKGYTIQPYSPKAGTGLSSHEVNQPGAYRDVTDTTIVAQFKADKNSSDFLKGIDGDVYFLAWTTTPWTLPSNTALTVGPKIEYVLIETFNEYTGDKIKVILAKDLVNSNLSSKKYIESFHDEIFTKRAFSWLLDFEKELADKKRSERFWNNLSATERQKIIEENESRESAEITIEHFQSLILFIQDLQKQSKEKNLIPFKIIETFKGSDLVGIKYEQLLPYTLPYQNPENAFRVISGDFVTTEDGTGIVHTAPTFGADDAKVAKEAIPEVPPMLVLDDNGNPVPLVDMQGKFISQMGDFAGKYVKNEYYDAGTAPERSVDVEIAIRLKEENKAFKVEKYVHSYPHSWRTDEPLLYYPLDSWFIKVTDVKDRMFDLNETINWKPKSTGEGRFGNWLKNANDWNLSRSRYWGIPLPIWRTEDKKEEIIIGSVEELYNSIEKSIEAGFQKENPFKGFEIGNMSEENYALIDLHKNIVDQITLVSASGKPMKRESDLIDVWFDSGAMPYAQLHYPFENKEQIDNNEAFPADFIAEGVDQTRGWFYTLHAIATTVFDSVAYKNVVSNGLVLDKNGQKMSKRLGNAVDPFETLKKYGPDATRWYMISNANPWENLKFDIEGIDEVRRKFFGTLYNTYSFFALYANVDGFKYEEAEIPVAERAELDRWILSELNSLIKKVDEFYADYEPTRAARAIQEFVMDNLSNWHVRLSRRRFWKGEYSKDKISAYQTLYTVLENVAILSAPIAPFFSDKLFKDLNEATGKNKVESVHLAYFPKTDETLIDSELEVRTQLAQAATSMILSLRKGSDMRVRQPLQKVIIPVLDETMKTRLESVSELLKQEVNVKEIQLLTNEEASHLLVKSIKPNFKTLGPKHGQDMKAISAATAKLTNDDIMKLESEGKIALNLDNKTVELELEDFEIAAKDIPGWTVTSNGNLTVALDIQLTDELRSEGVARELVNRIQNLRKESGLDVTDKIRLILKNDDKLETSVNQNKDYICAETLTTELLWQSEIEGGTKIEIDDLTTEISISKI